MSAEERFKTSASFAVLALSRYLLAAQPSWSLTALGYILVSIGNIIYCSSFSSQIRVWSTEMIVAASTFLCIIFFHCFADVIMSIPSLVFLLAAVLITSSITIVGAGSVCQHGHVADNDSEQASYIRLAGAIANTAGSTLFIMNLFGKRTETVQVVSRMLFYAAQALLFLANERTF